jgi:hypothetical protein
MQLHWQAELEQLEEPAELELRERPAWRSARHAAHMSRKILRLQ